MAKSMHVAPALALIDSVEPHRVGGADAPPRSPSVRRSASAPHSDDARTELGYLGYSRDGEARRSPRRARAFARCGVERPVPRGPPNYAHRGAVRVGWWGTGAMTVRSAPCRQGSRPRAAITATWRMHRARGRR